MGVAGLSGQDGVDGLPGPSGPKGEQVRREFMTTDCGCVRFPESHGYHYCLAFKPANFFFSDQ